MEPVDYKWRDFRPDLNGDWVVDFKDFAAFAQEWGKTGKAEQNIAIQVVGDGNDGLVQFGASGWAEDTQRIFLLIDGQYAGEIYGFRDDWPLGVDVSELGGGEHQLKAVSIDGDGQVTCSKITNTEFACPLNYCFCPKFYEPNEPVYFYGFYSGENDISVRAFEYGGEEPLWSGVCSGGDLSGFISAEITAANDIDYIEFKDISTGISAAKPTEKLSEPNSSIRALLILPNFSVNQTNGGVIAEVKETFRKRHIPFAELGCVGSSYKKIDEYAKNGNINYIYYTGDGNYINGEVYRTRVEIDDGDLYSFKPSNVRGGFDLSLMRFRNIKFAFFDCCYTGRLVYNANNELVEGVHDQDTHFEIQRSDMSSALRMYGEEAHVFQGWWGKRPTGMLNYKAGPTTKNPYHYFCLYEWRKLGEEGASLRDALNYAVTEVQKLPVYSEDVLYDFRLRGNGTLEEVTIH
jgi:hypothetical protein